MQPIIANDIKPRVRGQSEFFSWQLYRYVKKYPNASQQKVWSATWNSTLGLDGKSTMYIGDERHGPWIHARQLRNLCLAGQKIERYAYGSCHDTANWKDITEEFWREYMRIGVCAIHGDNAHRFIETGKDAKTCQNCGAIYVRKSKRITKHYWDKVE